jgi:hypothetical protein
MAKSVPMRAFRLDRMTDDWLSGVMCNDGDRWYAALRERLKLAAGKRSYQEIGRQTATHPESVRRYFTSGRPCARFLAAFSAHYGVSADWLLLGVEPDGGPTTARRRAMITVVADVDSRTGRVELVDTSCLTGTPPAAQNAAAG